MLAPITKNLTIAAIMLAGLSAHAETPLRNGSGRFTPLAPSDHSTVRCKDQQKTVAAPSAKLDPATTNATVSTTDQETNPNADVSTAELTPSNPPVISDGTPATKSKTPLPIPADPARSNLHWQSLLPGMMK